MEEISAIYRRRFAGLAKRRERVWRVLCRFFQRYIPTDATVVEIACGYGEFINNILVDGRGKKIAIDVNSDAKEHLHDGITFVNSSAESVELQDGIADVVFVSNFFEHLNSSDQLIAVLRRIHLLLRCGGRLIVLQPDIGLVGSKYWDFLDHKLPITMPRLCEAAAIAGLRPIHLVRRFLPYTMSGKMPVHPFLVSAYLKLMPISGWFMGKQLLAVFQK